MSEHRILVDAIHDSATVIHKGQTMNERIRELLDQSGLLDYTKIVVPEHEKFAELIVRECIGVVQKGGGICGAISSNNLKQHFFGVEE